MQVLIAGAGLAGLCAAGALAGAGCAVTIFDARDRLGGRVRTFREGLPERVRGARAFATDGSVGAFRDGVDGEDDVAASVVTFLEGGSASRELRTLADAGSARLLSSLCWLGSAARNATRHAEPVLRTTWEDDPWARGGYALIDPGFDPAWRRLLSKCAGRIVLAGEHTSDDWQG